MSKSGIRGKHDEDATQLQRNGGAKEDAHHGQHQGPHVSLPEKDKDEGTPGEVARPTGRPNMA